MPIRKYSKTTSDDLFIDRISERIDPTDVINSFDHGELDAVSIDFTDNSGGAQDDIDQVMIGLGYDPLGNEPNILIGTHILGKFITANEPTSMNAREGDHGYDTDKQTGVEYNGAFWGPSSLRSVEAFGGTGFASNLLKKSESFDETPWTDPSGNTTIVGNNATDPLGFPGADTVTWDTVGLGLRQTLSAIASTTLHTFSIWGRSVSGNTTIEITLATGSAATITFDSVLRRYNVPITSGSTGTNFDISVTGTVGVFVFWGADLSKNTVLSPYLKTVDTDFPGAGPGTVATIFNNRIILQNGIINLPNEVALVAQHSGLQAAVTDSLFGLNNGVGQVVMFFTTGADPNGVITPVASGDIALRQSGATSTIYQNRGGTINDWEPLAFLKDITSASRIPFATTTDTATLGFDKIVFACTDTTAPRTLTISNTTIALGSPTNVHRFTVKDESNNAGSGNFGILINTEGTAQIDGNPVASIERDSGALNFYTDGTDVFVEKEFVSSLSNISFNGNIFDAAPDITTAGSSIKFNLDGTKLFILHFGGGTTTVTEFSLVIPYSLDPGNLTVGPSTALSGEGTGTSLTFNNDGTKLFIAGFVSDTLREYSLNSGAFDLTTGVTAGPTADISTFENEVVGMFWNLDGTKVFVLGDQFKKVFECTVNSGAFDLTTGVTQTQEFLISSEETAPQSLVFSPDGTRFYITGATKKIFQYNLTTAFSLVSGVTFSGDSYTISSNLAFPDSVAFDNTGNKMFVLDGNFADFTNQKIYEHDVFPAFSMKGTEIDEKDTALRVDFAVSTNTGVLGVREIYACTDTSVPRTLTISSSTIAEGSPSRTLKFTVKDESDNASVNPIIIVTESGLIDTNELVSIDSNSGAIDFYTDGTNVFVEAEYIMPPAEIIHTGDFFDVSAQATQPSSAIFNDDGTKLFVLDFNTDDGFEYDLVVPFSIAPGNVTFSGDSFSFTTQESQPSSFQFNNDGTRLFLIGLVQEDIFQYNLTVPYSFAGGNVVFSGNSQSVSAQDASPSSIAFNNDGTKVFMLGIQNDSVNEYTLSVAFDLSSTFTFIASFSVASEDIQPESLKFNTNGTKMFFVGDNNKKIFEYNLTTAFSIASGVSLSAFSFDYSTHLTTGVTLVWNNNGKKFFMLDFARLGLVEFDVSPPFSLEGLNKESEQETALRAEFAVTTNTAALGLREIYACIDTSAVRTLTISSATIALGSTGKVIEFAVKDETNGAGTNNITIDTEGSELIDGVASVTISVNNGFLKFYADGSNVFIIGG